MLFVIVGSNFLFHNFKAPTNPDVPISNDDSNNNNDSNSNNNNNDLVTPPVPDDSNLGDYELSASENFVYSLIYADLTKQYDTFIGYVPLTVQTKSNGLNPAATTETVTTETYGISYVDYEEAYVDENGKTYFSAGFISFPNEPTITESNIENGLEIVSLEEETDEQFSYVYTYNTEDVHMHCIIDNKYVKYDIVDGTLQYQEEPFIEGMKVDDSRGNIYSYDIEDYVYIIEEIDYVPVSGVSIVGEADYQAIMDEVNRILETQEVNFTYAQIEQFISHSQDALTSYLLGLQEETFFGYATTELIETAKNLDPMQHLQIGVDENGNTTINLIEVTKKATLWEKITVSITCACGVVLGVVSTAVGAPVLAGAFIGVAMEAFSQVVINETPTSDIQWAQVAVAAVSGALAGGISAGLGNIATKGVGQVFMKEVADTLCDSLIGGTEFFVNSLIGGATFQEACGNFGYGVIAGAVISGGIKIGSATLKQGAKLIKKATTNTITEVAGKPLRKAGQEATEEAISETQEKAIQKNATKTAKEAFEEVTDTKFFAKYSDYHSRWSQTPSSKGTWTGIRGESDFILDTPIKLADGTEITKVTYKNAIPDFSPYEHAKVEISGMTSERYGSSGNFKKADKELAKRWTETKQNGIEWTTRDIENYRISNNLTWHEMNDTVSMQLVPTEVNAKFRHLGGTAECGIAENTTTIIK